jgi:bifunctional pyridoxal-dependent enzyme with beta-cystathionase and maltose regulon repressor activities
MNIPEEEIRENNFDEAPKILFTRKINDSMFDYSQKISSKIRSFSALAGMGYNYYISEYNKTIEFSQRRHTKNERKAWIYVSEEFLETGNMNLANNIEVVPV